MLYKMTGQTYLQQVAEFIEAFRVDLSRTALGCPTSNCHRSICLQARLKVSFRFIAKHFQHRRVGKCYFSFNLPPFSGRGIVGDQAFHELLLAPFCSALSIRLCNFKLKSICLQAMLKDPFTLIEKYFQHRKAGRHLVSLNHPAFPVRSESVLARFCSAQMAWF